IKSRAETEAVVARFRRDCQAYEDQAVNLVSTWRGSAKQKTERLVPMLALEIENCRKFVAEVFAPVPPSAEHLSADSLTKAFAEPNEARRAVQGVESLVVGIKYHRGHLDDIVQGDNVQLVREPDNHYDTNAVRVNLQSGETLGYLSKEFAAAMAAQMDTGGCPQAKVSRILQGKVYIVVTLVSTR
ncbi:MAG TPA: HIRAN domain-containing protein, partial [Verrucomicrobiae bacterium]|nr:HIRAN domain-containing protein [Verrucomicrobiae bacterium]